MEHQNLCCHMVWQVEDTARLYSLGCQEMGMEPGEDRGIVDLGLSEKKRVKYQYKMLSYSPKKIILLFSVISLIDRHLKLFSPISS